MAVCCLVMLLCCGNVFGQTTVTYNFETTADRNAWTVVNGTVTNKWCISKNANAQPSGSTYSLYVTTGSGGVQTTAQAYAYTNNSSSVVWAYRDITFPTSSVDYTFSFDWKCYGESSYDYFRVYIGPTTSTVSAGTSITAPTGAVAMINDLRTYNTTYFNDYDGSDYMTSTAANVPWRTYTTTLSAATYSGQTMRLFFVWKNDNIDGDGLPAAIDNIKLTYNNCTVPSGTFSLSETSSSLLIGETLDLSTFLTNNITQGGSLSYTSSAPGIAAVTNGVVRGVSEGTATITITYTPTSSTYCPRELTFTVNVSDGCPRIGTGTYCAYSYGPVNNYYEYGYYQYIFPMSDYSSGGDITSIAFQYCYTTAMTAKTNVKIYMGLTSASSFATATSWIPLSQLTLVYSGPLNCTTQGWNTFTLQTPFTYDGFSNLVIAIDDNSNAYHGTSYTFYCTQDASNYVTLYDFDYDSNIDPASPPEGSRSKYYPNTKLCIDNCTSRTLTFEQPVVNISNCSGTTSQSYSISPVAGGTVRYTSSNPDVATVDDNGVVTAHSAGAVTITATVSTYGDYCSARGSYVVNITGTPHTLTYNTTANCSGASAAPASTMATTTFVTGTRPTCAGMYFAGWNTRANGTGTSYQPGSLVNLGCSDVTLYAQYSTQPPTITGSSSCDNAMAFCASNDADAYRLAVQRQDDATTPQGFCNYYSQNATWWYLRISRSGPIEMTISSTAGDVDFACWGPFPNTTCDPVNDLTDDSDIRYYYYDDNTLHYTNTTEQPDSGQYTTNPYFCRVTTLARPCGNLVDYGTSSADVEYLQIANAEEGQIYVVAIGNYANLSGVITLTQTNINAANAGLSDCSIVNDCVINNISTIVGQCNGNNRFSVSGNISFTNAPLDGTLTITDGNVTQTFYPPFSSPQSYSLENLIGDGEEGRVITAAFSSSTINCSKITYIDAPTCETNCPDATVTLELYDEVTNDGMYYYNVCASDNGVNMSATQTGYTNPDYTWSVNPHGGVEPTQLPGRSVWFTPTAVQGYDVSLIVSEGQCRTVAHARIRVSEGPQPEITSIDLGDICVGETETITIGGTGSMIEVKDTTFDVVSTLGRSEETFIPDGPNCTELCYTSEITFYDFDDAAVITSADDIRYLRLNMEHSHIGDFQIKLTCPSGRSAIVQPDLYSNEASSSMYSQQAIDPYTYVWPGTYRDTTWLAGTSAGYYEGESLYGMSNVGSINTAYNGDYYLVAFETYADANYFITSYLDHYFTGHTYSVVQSGSYYVISYRQGNNVRYVYMTRDTTSDYTGAYWFRSQEAAQNFINDVYGGVGQVLYVLGGTTHYPRIYFGEPDIYDVTAVEDNISFDECDINEVYNLAGNGYDYAWTSSSEYTTVGYVYEVANMSSSTTVYNNGVMETNTQYHVLPSNVDNGEHMYQPFQGFGELAGCPLNGTWTISVCDSWEADNGYVFNWELAINPSLLLNDWSYNVGLERVIVDCGSMVSASGNDVVVTPASGSTMPDGCRITLRDKYGCDTNIPLSFNVIEPTLVHTSGDDLHQEVCEGIAIENIVYTIGGSATSVTVTGLPAGVTYNVNGNTVTISGAANMGAAGPYNYTITTVSGNGNCNEVELRGAILVKTGDISPTFTQVGPYCEGTPISVLPTTSLNGFTGTWSPELTNAVGTHTYTFTPDPAQCAIPTTMNITVNPLPTLEYTSGSETLCAGVAPTENIVFTFGGGANGAAVTGYPDGMEFNIVGSTIVISGTPRVPNTYTYTVTTTGTVDPCESLSITRTIIVNESPTLELTSGSNTQTVCAGSAITPLVYTYGGGAMGAQATCPAGLTPIHNATAHTLTISGTPTEPGTITVVTTGVNAPCESLTLTATVNVNELPELSLAPTSSANVSLCRDVTWASNIQYIYGGSATGATVSGLPDGITANVNQTTHTVTISGNPTCEAGEYEYTVTTVGAASPCSNIELGGTITVSTNATLDLVSDATTESQSLCLPDDDFVDIVYIFGGGATGATVTGLPAGITPVVNGAEQRVTISGVPSVTGTFNYTVTTTGSVDPCKSETRTGTITINRKPELVVVGNDNQSFCFGNPMTNLEFRYSGGATGALVTGVLPADLTTTPGTNTITIGGVPANPGEYHFSVTTDGAAGACSDMVAPVTINVYSNPTPAITTSETQICNGSSVTLTSNPATYNTYSWACATTAANITSGMPATTSGSYITVNPTVTSGTADITYSLTVSDENSCTASVSTAITVSDIPQANVNVSPNTKCVTPYNGTITVSGFTGASAGGTYVVTLNGTTQTSTGADVVFDGLEPDSYTVRVASESNLDACYTDYTVIINDNPTQPTVTISGQLSICDNTSTTLTAHADNGLGQFTYSWSDGSVTETIETEVLTSQRPYYVEATDENGCTAYHEVMVRIGDTPGVSISPASPICLGNSTVLQALVSNAGTTYDLVWTAAPNEHSGLLAGTGNRVTVTPTEAGSYQYTVRLTSSSCNGGDYTVTSDPITLVVNPLPTPGITNNTGTTVLTCTETSISLVATGGTSYAWSNQVNVAANTVNTTGTYTVTVTDANTCSTTTSITITDDVAIPQVAITEPASRVLTCSNNETIILNATTSTLGATLEWSTLTVTTPNTYTVHVTGANGCPNEASIEITRNVTPPTVGINNPPTRTITCTNPSIELTAYSNGTLSWETQTVTHADTYEVIATASNGCTARASIIIEEDKTPPTLGIIATGDTLSCRVLNVTLTASGARSYVWSDANTSTSASIGVTVPDTYRVTGTATNGCEAETSYTIYPDYDAPNVSIQAVTNTLTCDVRSINLAAQSTTLGTTFSWTTNRVTQPGAYSVVATGPNGCTATESIDIYQNVVLPDVSISAPDTVLTCSNDLITLTASGTGTLSWSSLDVTTPGVYELIATADNGCKDTARVVINQNISTPNVSLLNNTGTDELTCDIRSISVSVEDDSDADIYVWSAGGENTTGTGNAFTRPGHYSVTAQAPNGCISDASIDIYQNIENPTVSITNITGTNVLTCSVARIFVTAVGSASTVSVDSYHWSQGTTQTTADNTLVTTGLYVVTATASNGCTGTAQITIDESTAPPSIDFQNITGTTVLTCTDTVIEVIATGTGVSYQWSGGATPNTADNTFNEIGTYYVTATGSNGCTYTKPYSITESVVPPRVTISNLSGYSELNCANTLVNVTATGTATSYVWSNGITTADNTFTTPNTYTVTAYGDNGCPQTASIVITENHNAPTPSIVSANNIYTIDCDHPTLTLNGLGGVSYEWLETGETTSSIVVSTPGIYTVSVTGSNHCGATATVEIGINVEPPAAAINNLTGVDQIDCNVTSVHIVATGGYRYAWNNALWGGGPEQYVTRPGTYIVTVTGSNGCTATQSLTIIADTLPPTLQAYSTTGFYELNCGIDQIVVEATGNGISYAWSGGTNPTGSTNVFTNAGLYYVTSTGFNGCTSSFAVQQITTNYTAPTISIVDPLNTAVSVVTLNCITPDTTLTAQGTGISYVWNDNVTTASRTFTQTDQGLYTVTTTGSNHCQAVASVEIRTDFNTPAAQIINNTGSTELTCITNSISLTANGGTGATYMWSNGTNNRNIVITSPGQYMVTVTGANGCTNSNSVNVSQAPLFEPSITNIGTINCNGGTTSATVTATGGNPGYTYRWSDGQSFATANNLVAGSYTVTVSDNGGCSVVLSCSITEPRPLNVGLITHDLYCGVSQGSIDAVVTGGTTPYNYMWSNATTGTTLNNLQVGNYTLTVTDGHTCMSTATASIRMLGTLSVSASVVQQISCNGANDGVVAATCENGAAPLMYSWNTGEGVYELHNMFEGSYHVTVTDGWGCSGQSSVSLSAPAAMFVDLTPVSPRCYNTADGRVNVMVTGGVSPYSYAWNNASSSQSLTNVAAGTYSLTITDYAGCSTSRNVTIDAPDAISMEVATTDVKCFGDRNGRIEVSANGGTEPYRYSVERVLELSTSSMFTNIASGYYDVRVTDANGCEAKKSAIVKQPEEIKIDAVSEDPFCKNSRTGLINVSVIGGVSPYQYYWDNYMSDSSLMMNIPEGQYTVGVIDANECRSQTIKVTLVDVDVDCLRIPNVFTPNGDGINDEWIIANLNMFPEAQIYVFNRWGQLMFKTTGDGEPWDGSYRGHYVPAGTYIYIIDLFNDDEPYKGTVTIVY